MIIGQTENVRNNIRGGYFYLDNPQYNASMSMYNLTKRKQCRIVFAGDSITASGCFNEFFDEKSILNRGIGSDTAEGLYNRIDQIITLSPEKIFIMIGINDISTECDLNKTLNFVKCSAESIRRELPGTDIYIESVLPTNNKDWESEIVHLNKSYETLCREEGYIYVDIYSEFMIDGEVDSTLFVDNVHLNGKGYKVWIDCITGYVEFDCIRKD